MPMTESATLYCYVHPNRPTTLRCNRCERPICTQCAVRTPTGYRCRNCVREQQKAFDTAVWYDYLIGLGLTAVLSFIASAIISAISFVGSFFLIIISVAIAAGAGTLIANILLRVIRRRARALFLVIAAGVVIGALPVALFFLFSGNYFSIIWQAIYVVVATPTVYTRFSGIQL
jgi:B-box zinc finger protein